MSVDVMGTLVSVVVTGTLVRIIVTGTLVDVGFLDIEVTACFVNIGVTEPVPRNLFVVCICFGRLPVCCSFAFYLFLN